MIPLSEIVKDLKKVKEKIHKVPSMQDYIEHGSFNRDTVARKFGTWNKALKEIFGEIIKEKPPLRSTTNCPSCGKDTKNPKFCSRSCAAKINNSLYPKNPKKPQRAFHKCPSCGSKTTSTALLCRKCKDTKAIHEFGEKTIKEFNSTYARHRYQSIRNHAHRVARINDMKKECPFCDYSNHVELCHIKDIKDFDKNTKLKVVNSLDNLIYLCPNHHWDLDHGLLHLKVGAET
jgi:rRNA maturation protein Nop10